jgi:hypothetical protein
MREPSLKSYIPFHSHFPRILGLLGMKCTEHWEITRTRGILRGVHSALEASSIDPTKLMDDFP